MNWITPETFQQAERTGRPKAFAQPKAGRQEQQIPS
jgi:hypothetical protein